MNLGLNVAMALHTSCTYRQADDLLTPTKSATDSRNDPVAKYLSAMNNFEDADIALFLEHEKLMSFNAIHVYTG